MGFARADLAGGNQIVSARYLVRAHRLAACGRTTACVRSAKIRPEVDRPPTTNEAAARGSVGGAGGAGPPREGRMALHAGAELVAGDVGQRQDRSLISEGTAVCREGCGERGKGGAVPLTVRVGRG